MERIGKQKKSGNSVRMVIRRPDRIQRLDRRTIVKLYPELKDLVDIL